MGEAGPPAPLPAFCRPSPSCCPLTSPLVGPQLQAAGASGAGGRGTGGQGAGSRGKAGGGRNNGPLLGAGWRVGSPRPASLLLPDKGDEVIAPPKARAAGAQPGRSRAPARRPPPLHRRHRSPGPTMTERCNCGAPCRPPPAASTAAPSMQVQVRGRLGPR